MGQLAEVSRAVAKVSEWMDRRDEAIQAAYEAGHSLSEIGKAAGMTLEGVRRVLQRRDVQLRRRGRSPA